MIRFRWCWVLAFTLLLSCIPAAAQAVRIPLPKNSKYTPVQQLNRDGVKALKKHDVDAAKKLFYKAYLVDPNDPFTLNNLGYVAELEGDMDRAQRYYDQAKANTSEALVDQSTASQLLGKPVAQIAGHTAETGLQVNQLNSEALRLLNQDRAPEADLLLQQALKLEPQNPFTLNNMGFAKEKEGELEEAIRNYDKAAATRSREAIVVTYNKDWRGKPISEIAAQNAQNTRKELSRAGDTPAQVARLNLRGVSAMNRNDRNAARQYFQQAYKLDPDNSFTINNMGYLAELEGDRESAQFYYARARSGRHSGATVVSATRPEVEGKPVGLVADQSTALVDSSMIRDSEARKREAKAPVLRTRDNRIVIDKPANGTPYTPPEYRQDENSTSGVPQSDQPRKTPELKQRPPQQQPAQPQQSPPPQAPQQQPPQL